jgi:cation:H+ antiporter
MANLSIYYVILIFIAAAIATWLVGITITKTTDTLDGRFKLGDAFGGLVLLGITGSLPEIAVVYSAARESRFDVIIGSLLGGIAIQTLIIVIFDYILRKKKPLSYLAGSPILSFETMFGIILAIIALLGTFIPSKFHLGHISPATILIVIGWFLGLIIINKIHKIKKLNDTAEDALPGRRHEERRAAENHPFYAKKSNAHVILIFVISSLVMLVSGLLLEQTGTEIAHHFNIGTDIFAATVIALVCSLTHISTGIESIKINDNHLAVSDIIGGNAFMLVVFVFADLAAKQPVLAFAANTDRLLGGLGILMMTIYAFSFYFPSKKRYFKLGQDSIFVLLLYIAGAYLLTKML